MDAYNHKKSYYAQRGDWQKMFAVHYLSLEVLPKLASHSYFRARFFGWSAWAWAYTGRYFEGTENVEKGLSIAKELGDVESIGDFGRDFGFLLVRQSKYREAAHNLDNSLNLYQSLGQNHQPKYAFVLSDLGLLYICQVSIVREHFSAFV